MIDLFGATVPDRDPGSIKETLIVKRLGPFGYRPREETMVCCMTCTHSRVVHYSKTYYKCEFLGDSRSASTDIRAKHVCNHWEARAKESQK